MRSGVEVDGDANPRTLLVERSEQVATVHYNRAHDQSRHDETYILDDSKLYRS